MSLLTGFTPDLVWCNSSNAIYIPGSHYYGCLPHVNQSLFCCDDELVDLRKHLEGVFSYRKTCLNNIADRMDSIEQIPFHSLMCPALRDTITHLHVVYREARMLAIGGLEVLRMGLQDISCQLCWASDYERSAQVARILMHDLTAVFVRMQTLRDNLPKWQPCLPMHWSFLGGTSFPVDVSVRSGSLLVLQQWAESIAVAMTAIPGEFHLLATILSTSVELGEVTNHPSIDGAAYELFLPRIHSQSQRAALMIQGCAQISYPKVDIFTFGKEDCSQVWRKFPYADPGTSVMFPRAFVRVAVDEIPTMDMLSFLRDAVESPPQGPLELPPGLKPAPVLASFNPSVLQKSRDVKTLVFLCPTSTFCGGHGDRIFGLLSAYLASLLAQRTFFIDMRTPIALANILSPKQPWPAVTSACRTYRWTSAENLTDIDTEVLQMIDDTSDVICVVSNVRLFQVLLKHDHAKEYSRAGLLSGLFLELFSLAQVPSSILNDFRQRVHGRKLLGIHFRAGNESSWMDPARHGLHQLHQAILCAQVVEEALGLPDTTAWLLAADTTKVREEESVVQLHRAGKIVYLEDHPTHIDRSGPDTRAVYESWAVWWALAFETEAVLLSHSNFGWSAAEIGQRKAFHFPTCRPADVTSP